MPDYVMKFFFKHIEYLLIRHDCVIVPGLGAFIATRVPAKFDMETGELSAPARTIMFNQAVSSDDGLLTNSISRKAGISFEDARQTTSRYVNMIKEGLRNDGSIAIGNIGVISTTSEGNMLFSPSSSHQVDNRNMGYETIILKKESEIGKSAETSPEDETFDNDRYYNFRISKTFARIAAAMAAIITVCLAMLIYPIPTAPESQKASVVPMDVILPVISNEKENPEAESSKLESPVTTQNDTVTSSPSYYLIVATFRDEEEGKRYAKKNSDDCYHLEAVTSGRMTRVSVAASGSREELQQRLNSREISTRFPSSWIWTK